MDDLEVSTETTSIFEGCNLHQQDWLKIPDDVMLCIASKLIDVIDIIRFGAVCKSWRPIYIETRTISRNSQQIPFLLLSTDDHNNSIRSLYNVAEKRVLNFKIHMSDDMYCPGSSHGWLVTVSSDYGICLVNPLMAINNQILLPPLPGMGRKENYVWGDFFFLEKVALSANPVVNPNYIALAIYGDYRRLAYFKPGMNAWTSLSSECSLILDIIYYENRFYAVSGSSGSESGTVYVLDFNHPFLEVSRLVVPTVEPVAMKTYLVESSGDLLQVLRHTEEDENDSDNDKYFNNGFDVFKLDRVGNKWNKIGTLSGRSLFLGLNTSLSILASDFPGCKPNCIYYTDDYVDAWRWEIEERGDICGLNDMGIFNIEDGSTEQHYPTEGRTMFPAPIWIQPTL